jgi:hypothetical protein
VVVTIQKLAIETLFAADEATAGLLRGLANGRDWAQPGRAEPIEARVHGPVIHIPSTARILRWLSVDACARQVCACERNAHLHLYVNSDDMMSFAWN